MDEMFQVVMSNECMIGRIKQKSFFYTYRMKVVEVYAFLLERIKNRKQVLASNIVCLQLNLCLQEGFVMLKAYFFWWRYFIRIMFKCLKNI